jgi:hypothetical protein
MIKKDTERGFACYYSQDNNGQEFTLQKSSSAIEDKIWLGIVEPKVFEREWDDEFPGRARDYEMPDNLDIHSRMHLTREQVRDMLPLLQHFVDTGELP